MIAKEKNQLTASIVKTSRLLINTANSRFLAQGANITFEQLEALLYIASDPHKKIIQNELAIVLRKNKSAVLRTVDILEKKQYVKRIAVAGDRRKNVIEATAEGIKIATSAIEGFRKIEQGYMKKIDKEDILICNKVLGVISDECRLIESGITIKNK